MLGLLGRGPVGFAGPGSELQKGKNKTKHGNSVRECTLFHVWEEGRVFSLKQIGLTMVVCAVFPECFPFPEIERHAALGVNYHRE
jgi:hypothetical protein